MTDDLQMALDQLKAVIEAARVLVKAHKATSILDSTVTPEVVQAMEDLVYAMGDTED